MPPLALDQQMETASAALARMDYATCERLARTALAEAAEAERWSLYARILLPLQEARRQRRMAAAEGVVRLGTRELCGPPDSWLDRLEGGGCLAVTENPEAAERLERRARTRPEPILLLHAAPAGETWRLHPPLAPACSLFFPAPRHAWRHAWLAPETTGELARTQADGCGPGEWFLAAREALGDLALRHAMASERGRPRQRALAAALEHLPDHELLHQHLAEEARLLARQPA